MVHSEPVNHPDKHTAHNRDHKEERKGLVEEMRMIIKKMKK
jgi:hypothetical protein